MAGMALQCVKESGSHAHNTAELNTALTKIKQKLLASQSDGHIGNEFSTGLAVQVRDFFLYFLYVSFLFFCLKLNLIEYFWPKYYALCTRPCWQWAARLQSVLLQWKPWGQLSEATHITTPWPYLRSCQLFSRNPTSQWKARHAKMKMVCTILFLTSVVISSCVCYSICLITDSLVLEHTSPVVVLPSQTKVTLTVEVVASSGAAALYSVDVQKGSSLLEALELLKGKNVGFMWVHMTLHFRFYLSPVWLHVVSYISCYVTGLRQNPAYGDLS